VIPRREDGDTPFVKPSDAIAGLLVVVRSNAYDGPDIQRQPVTPRVLERLSIGEYSINNLGT